MKLLGVALWCAGMAIVAAATLVWWAAALGPVWGYARWETLIIWNRFHEAILEGVLLHVILVSQVAYGVWWLRRIKGRGN